MSDEPLNNSNGEQEQAKMGSEFVKADTGLVLTPGEVIKTLREVNAWFQWKLALKVELSVAQIIAIECEDLPVTDLLAERFADVFGVSVAVIRSPDEGAT